MPTKIVFILNKALSMSPDERAIDEGLKTESINKDSFMKKLESALQ